MSILRYIVVYFASTVVLASTTCLTPTTPPTPTLPVSKRGWIIESASSAPLTTGPFKPHAPWNITSPWGWNATHTSQATGTASVSHPTTTVTVGEAGKLVFSPSSLNASAGSVIAFNFLGLNHTLTQSHIGDPCRSNQGFDTGFLQFNPANVSGKFIVEIEVVDQDARWFFCAQTVKRSHCQAGMVFSLNPHGAHAQFLHNALAGVEVTPTPTNSVCGLPPVYLTTSNASTHSSPTGTLSANSSISSVAIPPPILNSAGTKGMAGVWFMLAVVLL
jgi:plastocyanin